MRFVKTILIVVCSVFLALSTVFTAQKKTVKYTGTFTSLEYSKEGGDLLGEEIKIVLAEKGYQAALQIAEGEPGRLMLVDVFFENDKVKFEIPSSYPTYGGGVFDGKIDALGIRGILKFKGDASNPVKWTRGHSYWDK